MLVAGPVDFFYGLGSRYSYLASTQIARLEADTGCQVRWRPLYSADLFALRGADPFRGRADLRPVRLGLPALRCRMLGRLLWRAVPRAGRCRGRVAAAGARRHRGRAPGRGRAVQPAAVRRRCSSTAARRSMMPACRRLAGEVGLDRDPLRAGARGARDRRRRSRRPSPTRMLGGVFGVPSFVVGGHVYLGNDRLPIVRHVLQKKLGSTA